MLIFLQNFSFALQFPPPPIIYHTYKQSSYLRSGSHIAGSPFPLPTRMRFVPRIFYRENTRAPSFLVDSRRIAVKRGLDCTRCVQVSFNNSMHITSHLGCIPYQRNHYCRYVCYPVFGADFQRCSPVWGTKLKLLIVLLCPKRDCSLLP